MRCAIWYHLYNLKRECVTFSNFALTCNFTKSNTPPWVFFTFFKLYKWYQIAQNITYIHKKHLFLVSVLHEKDKTFQRQNHSKNVL